MRIYEGPPKTPLKRSVVAVGNFDGVHVGHQRIFALCVARARECQGAAVVLTFDPHPAKVLAPALAPSLILPMREKLDRLAACAIDVAVLLPFTRELAQQSPEQFFDNVLIGLLGACEVVVGYDFTFGKGRAGTVETLMELGRQRGVTIHRVAAQTVSGVVASSTKVRQFVLQGQMDGAALLLGRPFELQGVVVQGAGRGRTLGFPTANIQVSNELLPREGVYAGRVRVQTGARAGWQGLAAVNIGRNPTFVPSSPGQPAPVLVEAHLIDFDADLYGAELAVGLVERLRGETRFASVDELKRQIEADVAMTRQRVGSEHGNAA